jgi:FAD/FMN-containing dehydrogenase
MSGSGFSRRQFLVVGTAAAVGITLTACTTDGDWITLEDSALNDLASRLQGRLLLPGNAGFTAAWFPTNGRFRDTVPIAVARVASDQDVVVCLAWTQEHGLPFCVRGGGHSYAGLSTTTGLVIDLSLLNSVVVDRAARTMVTGGAATNGNIFSELDLGDAILPGGTCLSVGIGGLVLGGGIGYHTRWAGLTSDHLVRAKVITAGGDIVTASADENADLFWALRGGSGGTFGVCTEFEFELVPVPQQDIIFYRFDWTGADAAIAMLSAVDALEQTAPPEFVASGMAQATPTQPGASAADSMDVMLRGQFLGSRADFDDLIAPVLAGNAPAKAEIVGQPFWRTAAIFTSQEAENHSWGDISRYTDRALPTSTIEALVQHVAEAPSRSASDNAQLWMLGWVGGDVVDRFSRGETAYVHRGVRNMLRPSPVWSNLSAEPVARDLQQWTDAAVAIMEQDVLRESYQNFPNLSLVDWQELYYAENLQRLIDVKTQWDPDNRFTSAQTIAPR